MVAVQSGLDAHEKVESIPGVRQAVNVHQDYGEDTRDIFLVVSAIEIAMLVLATRKPGLTKGLRALSAVVGIVGAVDAIQAGLRTTGYLSIVDYPGFEKLDPPDMETYSKALNAGQYPMSVLAMTEHAAGLYRKGIYGNTMTANPRAVRHFAHALMKRSKNDPIDVGVLLEFVRRMPFQPWVRPSPAALALHALAHRLESLTEMHAAEKNRLHAAKLSPALPAAVARDLQRSLRSLERALDRITCQAVQVIGQDSDLNVRYQLLLSACGIAPTSAVQILAQLAVLAPNLDVRQGVAQAGLDPRQYSSGSSVHKKPRISKHGNVHLRRALRGSGGTCGGAPCPGHRIASSWHAGAGASPL